MNFSQANWRAILAAFMIGLGYFSTAAVRGQQEARTLEPGQPITREIAGRSGEMHAYQIALAAGQFLRVVVEQTTVGAEFVKAELIEPGSKLSVGLSSVLQLTLSTIAETSGIYRIEVKPAMVSTETMRYRIKVVELRAATAQDHILVTADRAVIEAKHAKARQITIDKYQEALTLFRSVGDRRREAEVLSEIGRSQLGFEKKLDYLKQSRQLYQALGERRMEALVLYIIGHEYDLQWQEQNAFDQFNQALSLFRALGDHEGEANTLYRISVTHHKRSDYQNELDYLNQSLLAYQATGDPRKEALALDAIGHFYNGLGEPQNAIEYCEKSRLLLHRIGDGRSEADQYGIMAGQYKMMGEWQKAQESLDQVLKLYQADRTDMGKAKILKDTGVEYEELGAYQKALDCLNLSLTLTKLKRENNIAGREGNTLVDIGIIYGKLGEKQKALDYLNQANASWQNAGWKDGYERLGTFYECLDEKQKALEYYRQRSPNHPTVATLYDVARLERDLGDLSAARAHIETAIQISESIRAQLPDAELRAAYFSTVRHAYELDIDLLMQFHLQRPSEGFDALALQVSERARARTLLEVLSEARVDLRQGMDPKLIERQRSLEQQLNLKMAQQAQPRGQRTAEETAAVKQEIKRLTDEYTDMERQIRAASPRYGALTQPVPLKLEEIKQQVLDSDTLLLEYVLGDERSYLWAVTQTELTSYQLPGRAEIEKAVRPVNDLLKKEDDTQYWREAGTLSRILLGPVASKLGAKRLLIVADGALQYVSFAALPAPVVSSQWSVVSSKTADKYQPLIVEHEIVSLPSASTLAALRQVTAGRPLAPKTVAVLADPVFDREDERVSRINSASETVQRISPASDLKRAFREVSGAEAEFRISRLPLARREADAILSNMPASEQFRALDFQASRATAISDNLEQFRIVHFATHGLLNSSHPQLSGVVLSLVDEHGAVQDGFLRLNEIYNLKLSAELVVLSACQTGLGKEIKGEGLVGLTRGFMHAGAKRVAASLWKVDDAATAELMKRFYAGMLGEKRLNPAAALREAQVEMWKQKRWQSPYNWAGFVLQGEYK